MNNGGKNSSYQELFSLNEKEEESGKSITGGQTLSHILFKNSDRGSVPSSHTLRVSVTITFDKIEYFTNQQS